MQYIQAIKRFVKARTPKGLEREMLRNNVRKNSYHDYQIVWDGKEWFAWYLDDKNDPMKAVEELNDASEG
jgi:hypothetical protein